MAQSQDGVKFLHFRSINDDGVVDPRSGLTVAYRRELDGIRFAEARCHSNDNFVKAVGRAKAGGRLNSSTDSYFERGEERDFVQQATYTAKVLDGFERKYARSSRSK